MHSFSCPSNGLLELDESLRLLPSVQVGFTVHLQLCAHRTACRSWISAETRFHVWRICRCTRRQRRESLCVCLFDFRCARANDWCHIVQYCSSLQYLNLAFNVIGTVEGINRTIGNCKTVILRGNRLNSLGVCVYSASLLPLSVTVPWCLSLWESSTRWSVWI